MKTKLKGIEQASRVLLAVLAGFLVWGSAVNTEFFQVAAKLPVKLTVNGNLVVLSMSAESVTVVYTGSGWEMLSFQLKGVPPSVDTEYQVESGTVFPAVLEIEVNPAVIDPEGSVAIERVTPSRITCSIDTVISRNVPAAPIFTDGIPGRFRFIVVEPGFTTVSGPRSSILRTDSVATEPVQAESSPYFSSLAPCGDMVAYSSDSVRVQVYDPVLPFPSTAVRSEGLLTP